MANGISGYVDFGATNGFTIRIHYAETYNTATNKSDVAITNVQLKGSTYWANVYYLDGSIKINGSTAVEMDEFTGSHYIYVEAKDTFYDIVGTLGSVSGITHASDGSKTVAITVSISGYTKGNEGSGTGSGWSASGSKDIKLTTFSAGYIYIDNGSKFEAYQCYIDNGSGWDQYVPYIDNGSSW